MVKTINGIQHTKKNSSRKKWNRRWKSVVLINEQRFIRRNNGTREKQNRWKTRKQQEILFKIYIKTKLYVPKIFDNNSVTIHKSKVALKLNKLVYIGICILEFSKVLIYKFHYDYIKNKYGNKSKLLFTDTDSLMYEIKTGDVYEDLVAKKKNV